MKIYTKTGDTGQTRIYVDTVETVKKDDAIVECYGTLDELNANIGLLQAHCNAFTESLQQIQKHLFTIGFALSASSTLEDSAIVELEQQIDHFTAQLPAQTHFILPAGCVGAAQAHVCRTVCRRAERRLVTLSQHADVSAQALSYINRLSDWLFVFARWQNHLAGVSDIKV